MESLRASSRWARQQRTTCAVLIVYDNNDLGSLQAGPMMEPVQRRLTVVTSFMKGRAELGLTLKVKLL